MELCDKEKTAHFDYSRLGQPFAMLSKPAQRALISSAIYTAKDLAKWSRADLAKLHGIGPSVFPKLENILRADSLEFKG